MHADDTERYHLHFPLYYHIINYICILCFNRLSLHAMDNISVRPDGLGYLSILSRYAINIQNINMIGSGGGVVSFVNIKVYRGRGKIIVITKPQIDSN